MQETRAKGRRRIGAQTNPGAPPPLSGIQIVRMRLTKSDIAPVMRVAASST
jgi:hypothetical protein